MHRIVVGLFCAALLAGCGKPTAEEYLQQAMEAEQKARQAADTLRTPEQRRELFLPVVEAYERVIAEYPDSQAVQSALFRQATLYNNDLQDYARAIDGYRKCAEKFPGSDKAAVSLFLMGYIYNNQLGQLDSARAAYERFLQRYPDHEMAISAQFELNSLGKSPDELLPKEEAHAGNVKSAPKKK